MGAHPILAQDGAVPAEQVDQGVTPGSWEVTARLTTRTAGQPKSLLQTQLGYGRLEPQDCLLWRSKQGCAGEFLSAQRPAMKMATLPGSAEDTTSFGLGPSGRGSLLIMQWSGHHLYCHTPLSCTWPWSDSFLDCGDDASSSDFLHVKREYFLQGRPESDEP
ncbi:uncharacterized protein M6G45_014720 isoform 1-T1 [Spheniscus humboldti]